MAINQIYSNIWSYTLRRNDIRNNRGVPVSIKELMCGGAKTAVN